MYTRRIAIGAVSLVAALAASSAVAPGHFISLRGHVTPGVAHLRAFGGRSLAQTQSIHGQKLDGALADLSRHLGGVRATSALADLRGLSPAARFSMDPADGTPGVYIDAVTRGDPMQLKAALEAIGLKRAAVFSNDVGGWLPVNKIDAASALAEVHSVRASMLHTRAVAAQGDFVLHSDLVRANNSLSGAGITVGVLSDSFDCYSVYAKPGSGVPAPGQTGYAQNGFTATASQDVASGDLPANVNVIAEAPCLSFNAPPPAPPTQVPFGDEGRAMLQVVHSVAPGANLVFYTAEPNTAPGVTTEAGFANGILTLAKPVSAGGGGAKVIADDVGYYDEPFFQDGILAQAVDTVVGQGVAYFSAAGNESNYSYERPNPNFSTPSITPAGELLMSFDGGITTSLPLSIDSLSPGQFIAIVVQWDQPYVTGAPTSGGASSQIDICVTGQTGSYTVTDVNGKLTSCTGPNMVGSDPVQILILGNPANAASSAGNTNPEVVNLTIGLAGLTSAPTLIKLAVETNGQPDNPIPVAFQTNSPTVQGHPGAAGAAAVGAAFYVDTPACGTTPAMVEPYSSMGGGPILFDVAGTRLATPQMRQKPNFVGPDGINDTFLGQVLAAGYFTSTVKQCQNNANFPNFLGTSAATPHAAGVAALLLQANPALTPAEIYNAMQSTASAMGAVPNASSGYGFIQADAALASVQVKPLPPTVSVTPTSITAGGMATLNWSAVNATGCTASGTWSGAQKASGSMTISPATTGTFQYSLACTNSAGVSGVTNASLTVTAANTGGGGHGGGALGEGLLLGLAGLGAARMRRVLRCGKGA